MKILNYWFVVHSLKAFEQHNDLIGCGVKEPGIKEPSFGQFSDIRKGDRIVYYATKDCVVVGVFEVVSDMIYLHDDPYWKEEVVYKIKPVQMPSQGFYLDFKKVIGTKSVRFDLFPVKEHWHAYLRGKTCRKLTDHDYPIIEDYLKDRRFLAEARALKVKVGKIPETLHEPILESLLTVGEIFGFESVKKPNVNQIRPVDQPFKARGKTLDLAWRIFGLTWVPFEIQVHGSVPDLIYRFNLVHQWSLKMVIVADSDFHDEIQEAAQNYPFAGKLVLLTPQEIEKATKDLSELKNLRQRIFL